MIFLVAGSLLFWLVIACAVIAVSVAAICERTGLATLIAILAVVGLEFFSTLPVFAWMLANPLLVLGGIAAYLAIGVVWVYPKWMSFINDVHDTAMDAKAGAADEFKAIVYLNDNSATRSAADKNTTLEMVEAHHMAKAISAEFGSVRKRMPYSNLNIDYADVTLADLAPEVSYNKARILSWMTYWPVSMFWTLLNDPIRRFYQWVYRSISGSLQRMSDSKFSAPAK